jgi:probable rRNA maturation factor
MILLDPELADSAAGKAGDAKPVRGAVSRTPFSGPNLRLPAARTLSRFLAEAQTAVRLRGQVSVLLTTDASIRRLNRRFRRIDKTTDVLSFPAADSPEGPERVAGDLAIGVPAARRQAVEHGHALAVEIKILILHGLLHLAGYDHEADNGRMARRERLLRERLGLPSGLIERVSSGAVSRRPAKKAGLKPGARS